MRLAACLLLTAAACATQPPPPTAKPATHAQRMDGFVSLSWDDAQGRLHLRLERLGEDILLQTSLATGVGSNPLDMDRGQLGATRLVRFERVGPKVLLVEPPTRFRVHGGTIEERRAVEESFASSVLWSFTVESSDEHGVVVDGTDFFLSDSYGVAAQLRVKQQGSYRVDAARSAIYLPRTRAFPRNTEVEAILTFTGEDAGPLVRSVTPSADAITVRQHLSFIAAPPPGYRPRVQDPRIGLYALEIYDFGSRFDRPLETRWIARHRLEKKDPSAAVSEAVQPIVYYVDPATPQPIRDAVIEGASWWAAAFEAAGFRDAFRVELLPADADPMDVRYNVIHWIHRSTRGWAFGESLVDPRTGEVLKGNVRLDSQRIRQDVLLARGLVPQYDELGDEAFAALDPRTSPTELALARIRQLAAHEVGHSLGLDHNMGGSSEGRTSVMDYPAPQVAIVAGKLDLSDAYARGVGSYDKVAIRYAYTPFAPADEAEGLKKIVHESPLFIQDVDSRPLSSSHPAASLWDGGDDAVAGLRHELEVRRLALEQFGLRSLAVGEPLSSLEEKLVPLYLHHRYQIEAAAKLLGGASFTYAVKERGAIYPAEVRRLVPGDRQRAALAALLATLEPAFLTLPPRLVALLPPRAYGTDGGVAELFPRQTGRPFDPVAAAMTAADLTLGALLEPTRASRLIQSQAETPGNPGLQTVTDALIDLVMKPAGGTQGLVARGTRALLVTHLEALVVEADDPEVRAEAADSLRRLAARCVPAPGLKDRAELAHRLAMRADIAAFLARPPEGRAPRPQVPPGMPI